MKDIPTGCRAERATIQTKRSQMTNSGRKGFRVHPTVNNSAVAKYQPKSQPRPRASTPIPLKGDHKDDVTSCTSEKAPFSSPNYPLLGSTCSSPSQYFTNYRKSDHTKTFTCRNRSCTPPHVYMNEHLHKAAVQLYRGSSGSSGSQSRQTLTSSGTQTGSGIPSRHGKRVSLPSFMKSNPYLKSRELTMGQKQYLCGIAKIYSISQMKNQLQQQYQALLDRELKKRLQRMGISEREKLKETKDYLRYKKFIKNYDQRIPRESRSKDSGEEKEEDANYIHRHVLNGWTTRVISRGSAQTPGSEDSPEAVESERDWERTSARGAHIYKHVIKGWTMDPHANEGFQRISDGKEQRDGESDKMKGERNVSVYRVDIVTHDKKNKIKGDVMRITRLDNDALTTSPARRDIVFTNFV